MTQINRSSIVSKFNSYVDSKEGQTKIGKASRLTEGDLVEKAAKKFIEILQQQIDSRAGTNPASGGLGATAVASFKQLTVSSIDATSDFEVVVNIDFADNMRRESVLHNGDGVEHIAFLLNQGYSARRSVHGEWHNEQIWTIARRTGSHFIDDAITEFMIRYADEYGVIRIETDQ